MFGLCLALSLGHRHSFEVCDVGFMSCDVGFMSCDVGLMSGIGQSSVQMGAAFKGSGTYVSIVME